MFSIHANTLSSQAVTVTSSADDVIITIDGVAYTTAFITSAAATATAFVTAHGNAISVTHKLFVSSSSAVITFYGLENLSTGGVVAATAECTIAAIVASAIPMSVPFADNTVYRVTSATLVAYVPSPVSDFDTATFTFVNNAEAVKYFGMIRGLQENAGLRPTARTVAIDWPCTCAVA
jgi:hypothetical protein